MFIQSGGRRVHFVVGVKETVNHLLSSLLNMVNVELVLARMTEYTVYHSNTIEKEWSTQSAFTYIKSRNPMGAAEDKWSQRRTCSSGTQAE